MEIVKITDLAAIAGLPDIARDLILGGSGPKVKLGRSERDERVNSVLQKTAASSETLWLLSWKGTKTPHGAVLGEAAVSHAQNGIVASVRGDTVGTYERLVEWGGPNRDEHMMLVWAY